MDLDVLYPKSCQKMPELPDESIDFMPTDPPYGINFMNTNWIKANEIVNPQGAYEKKKGFKKLPRQSSAFMKEFFTPIWKECFRVLKPGAFAFVMCIPRQDCLARQIISLEDAGFNVSFSPIFHAFAQGFPKSQNISKAVDKRLGAKRKVVGKNPDHRKVGSKALYRKGATVPENITTPATPQAQALDGSYAGMQLKPSLEVCIAAMKPLSEKTYLDQALKNRKGITWLGNGRIPYKGKLHTREGRPGSNFDDDAYEWKGQSNPANPQGRFPANLLVSDDALNDGKQRKTGNLFGSYEHGGGKMITETGIIFFLRCLVCQET